MTPFHFYAYVAQDDDEDAEEEEEEEDLYNQFPLERGISAAEGLVETDVKLAVVDLVNPRLAKFPHGFRMAVCIILLQICLIMAAMFCFRYRSKHLKYKVAESQDLWSNVNGHNKVCATLDATSSTGRFDHPCLVSGARSCNEYDCFRQQPVYYPGQNAQDPFAPQAWKAEKRCSDTPCNSDQIVRVVFARQAPWLTCFVDALATIGSMEVVVTSTVVTIYMCYKRGPGWILRPHDLAEVSRVAVAAASQQEVEAMHAGK